MQGNLQEIDISSLLQLIELGQRTGQLWITIPNHDSSSKSYYNLGAEVDHKENYQQQCWLIFFVNGEIVYCQAGDSLSRVDDNLRHHRVEVRLEEEEIADLGKYNPPEYDYLWLLLERNIITPKVAENILYRLVVETLFEILNLHQGSFIFQQEQAIAPRLTSWAISPLVKQITQQLQQWYELYPYIHSPEQLLVLADKIQLHSTLPEATVTKLKQWADGQTTLRQLARYLNRDIVKVAKTIFPYIQQGWLKLIYPHTHNFLTDPQNHKVGYQKSAKILCIDDTKTICDSIESILQPRGYQVLSLTNPLEAMSLIFHLRPNLVLCDVAMPELNGYELCSMLRQSQVFRYIPMIMLSSKDKFIDQIKAKMVGATDYLTKPFDDTQLLMLVEKYINV